MLSDLQDPIQAFLYALKAPETKRKYPQRLKFFFDFVFSDFDIKIQAREFIKLKMMINLCTPLLFNS